MPGENTEYTGPVARDPLLGHEVPVYLGGEGPVEMPEGDRGDSFAPSSEPLSSLPQGSVASALAEAAKEPAAEPEVTPQDPEPKLRRPDGTFMSKAEIEAAKNAETQGEEAKDEEAKGEDDEPRIPKKRLDQEIQKRRALEQKLAEKEAAEKAGEQGAKQEYDFDAAERQYMDLLLDGKVDEAAAKRKEIRAAERAETEALAARKAKEVDNHSEAEKRMDAVSTRFEADYPQFNGESDQFDPDALATAEAIYIGYLNKGLYADPVDAFEAALDAVVKINGWTTASKPRPQPTPQTRTAEKRAAAIGATPPLTTQAGQSSAAAGAAVVPDVTQLTEDQLNKLPPATLKRLRGDEL